MDDIIKLSSRGINDNYLKKMSKTDGSESKTYVLKTEYNLRAGFVDDIHKFVDPAGGPMIVEGEYLKDADAKVKFIDSIVGVGYLITFE